MSFVASTDNRFGAQAILSYPKCRSSQHFDYDLLRYFFALFSHTCEWLTGEVRPPLICELGAGLEPGSHSQQMLVSSLCCAAASRVQDVQVQSPDSVVCPDVDGLCVTFDAAGWNFTQCSGILGFLWAAVILIPPLSLYQPLGSFKLAKQLGGKLDIVACLIPHMGSLEDTDTTSAYGKSLKIMVGGWSWSLKKKSQRKLHMLNMEVLFAYQQLFISFYIFSPPVKTKTYLFS